jgi:hypothetical protein
MTTEGKKSRKLFPLGILAAIALIFLSTLFLYQPDRPVDHIVPGSSSGPAFVVQIIRPRMGLPLGGILPPQLFGLDATLGFETSSPGADLGKVEAKHIELTADDWQLVLVLDAEGRVTPETQVVFEFLFEENLRTVRCRPADPAIASCNTTMLAEASELSGSFDIELARCEDAKTGERINWPPEPLRLYGSFDRLPLRKTGR